MILSLKNVSKGYINGGKERVVLDNISLEISKGESIAIVGPSGAGKTTMLNLLGTLDAPDHGSVEIAGMCVTGLKEKELAKVRNNELGFVFQLHHLLPQCTLLENVLIPTLPQKKNKIKDAEALLKELGIWDFRHQLPGELSGGECQRTAVARALINTPSILLADEPTGALDEKNAETLVDLLLELNKTRNMALVLVTHSLDVAGKMNKVFVLHGGKLIEKRKGQ